MSLLRAIVAWGETRAYEVASSCRVELAVDDDPPAGHVVIVDDQLPERPAGGIPPDAQRHADRHRLVQGLKHADGIGHSAVGQSSAVRAGVGER